MTNAPLLLLEFNELCPALIERFIAQGVLPHFKQLQRSAQCFITDAEESGEKLNPWVQWATIHTGLSASDHGIETLSEGQVVAGKNVWDVLSEQGRSSWICGSMNASYGPSFRGCLIPDPWSTGVSPYPADRFDVYSEFVRGAVQEHSNEGGGITAGAARRFLMYMLSHGLTLSTITAMCRQLISERVSSTKWRRAAMMDVLQADLFCHVWRKTRPAMATFFLNSTAHFQHCYWRHFEPQAFTVPPSTSEQHDLADAIPYGYRAMDKIVGRLLRLVGDSATVVFCTGLSQQPYLRFEEEGGRNYYRIRTSDVLAGKLGVTPAYECEPVMAEQFYLRFSDVKNAEQAARQLESLRVASNGAPADTDKLAFHLQRRGESLLVQCNRTDLVPQEALIWSTQSAVNVSFFEVFYRLEALKSGSHHPDGVLWIRHPGIMPRRHPEKVSLRAIAPLLLHLLGVQPPPYMDCLTLLDVLDESRSMTPCPANA